MAYNRRVSSPFGQPIHASTRICAVYGFPVRHSASPAMQNAGIAELGLNWRYLACELPPEELRAALEGAKAMRFIGVNLTVPHKLLAMDLMDQLDESARMWGAVNTVRFEGQDGQGTWQGLGSLTETPNQIRMHGFNTDADAITRSLKEDLGISVRGGQVLLLGAGGAGRTAALKLASEKVDALFLVNRTQSKAEALADEIRQRFPETKVSAAYPGRSIDLLLNATSMGLKDSDPLPLDESKFALKRAGAVYDMIYRPAETRLLKAARRDGIPAANGLGMLLYQGASALEIWSGQPAPIPAMRQALEKNIYG